MKGWTRRRLGSLLTPILGTQEGQEPVLAVAFGMGEQSPKLLHLTSLFNQGTLSSEIVPGDISLRAPASLAPSACSSQASRPRSVPYHYYFAFITALLSAIFVALGSTHREVFNPAVSFYGLFLPCSRKTWLRVCTTILHDSLLSSLNGPVIRRLSC